jgi:hypothetical protein
MLTYVVDFDDLTDDVAERSLEFLTGIRKQHPAFQATLFTIPNRTSEDTIAEFASYPWLALAPHGWHHTRGECLTWTIHEAVDKITLARQKGIIAPAFRAPAWLIGRPVYEACRDLGIVVCDHKDNYLHVPSCNVYRYNDPAWRAPKIRPVHGHLTNSEAVDNYIGAMIADNRLSFATEAQFKFPWQVSKEMNELPKQEVAQ